MIALFAALLAGTATLAAPAIPSVSQPLGHDDRGRPQIDVSINEQGPFPMVVDTAAQSSLMSPDLAAALKLAPMDSDLSINGATGSTRAQIYPVDHFASTLFDEKMVGVLMFPNPGTTSARGIVGMEHFGEGKLTFDRTNARLSFGPSAPAGTGFATHKGELHGGLLVVPLTLDGVAVKATVDTGAGVTIANAAALKALGWSADDSRLVAAGTIRGATSAQSAIRMGIDVSASAVFGLTDTITFNTNATASYLIRLEQDIDGQINRFDGSLGGCNWTSCSGAPRFRASWQNTLTFDNKTSLTLTAYYTSGYSSTSSDAGGTYKDCAASAEAGQLVTYPDSGNPVQCHGHSTFDLDGHVETKIADGKFTLYADVLNILDGKPNYDPNAAYGVYQFSAAWQDRLFMGRYMRIGAKVDF